MNDLTPEQCRTVLEEGMVAHPGVISDGEAYVSPMSYVLIGDDIVFRTLVGRPIEAIKEHPRV